MAGKRGSRSSATRSGSVQGALQRLAAMQPGDHRVVSCYLKLEPRDRVRGKYLIKVKNRVRALQEALPRLGLDRQASEAASADLDSVLDWLRAPGNLPSSQGVAIFASRRARLFAAVPLPFVHRSRLAVDRTPLVRELVAVEEEFGRIYSVVVDRTSARVFAVSATGANEVLDITADSTRGGRFHGDQNGPGWGEHTYNNRIRQEKQRHYETVAQELLALDRREPARGIVLAGIGADATALAPFLPASLQGRLFGSARLNPKELTPAQVHAATLEVREEHKRAEERQLLELVEAKEGEGWAVNGVRDTLRALGRGQVRTLLVSADASLPGWRSAGSGRLAINLADCRGEGEPLPVVDVIDDAIEEALRQRVEVNVVYGREQVERIDGLAGLLRFR
jgi:peptide subunit release factor 1 (eRF1)